MPQQQPFPIPLPRIPGHELIGEVVAVSEIEAAFKVGDVVASGWHGGCCRECSNCRAGNYNLCSQESINGMHLRIGDAHSSEMFNGSST